MVLAERMQFTEAHLGESQWFKWNKLAEHYMI